MKVWKGKFVNWVLSWKVENWVQGQPNAVASFSSWYHSTSISTLPFVYFHMFVIVGASGKFPSLTELIQNPNIESENISFHLELEKNLF